MKIIEFNFLRKIEASYDAIIWNYWDHEHLCIAHEGYTDSKILYEDNKVAVNFLDFKIPIFSFLTSKSLNFMYLQDRNTIKTFNVGLFGLFSETTIKINEVNNSECELQINYKFYLRGWLKILQPFLGKMAESWNQKVWNEDLNLKKRRTKLINLGFKDFIGMTQFSEKIQELELPIKRHKDSPVNIKKN
jgi:hypothetical protein